MIVFVCIPTAGTVLNGALTDEFLKHLADLHVQNPDLTFVAPMVQDYQILKFMKGVEPNWEAWGDHCRKLIERADIVLCLKYPGWDVSKGVTGELQHAALHHKPTVFLKPGDADLSHIVR